MLAARRNRVIVFHPALDPPIPGGRPALGSTLWPFALQKCVNEGHLAAREGEGEAPAEPWWRQLGRSLALPLEPLPGSFHSAVRLRIRRSDISRKCQILPTWKSILTVGRVPKAPITTRNAGPCHFDCPRSEKGNWLVTTRKTSQRPSRHILRMAILAASPWFVGANVFAQLPQQPNSGQPTSPRNGLNAIAMPQGQMTPQSAGVQPFVLPPPAQGQIQAPAARAPIPVVADAKLQVYDVPLEHVGEVGARIQTQFGADKRVRVTNEPNTGRLMVLAPDATQKQIAQVVEASRRQVGSLHTDLRGNIIPSTVQQNQYKLQRISWRELEDAVGRLAGSRLTISTSNNGELAQLKMVSKDSVQEVMQVDRRNNEVRLQGTPTSVMGWTQVITAIDIGQVDPNRPTQIIPINPATPERIERALKLIKLASYQQPGQLPGQEDEATGTAQIRPRTGDDERATIIASPDAVSAGSGLIGDVDISFVPEMGLVIIKGSKRDVQRVQEVIEQIKKQSTETQPQIEIVPLTHVNGQALEVILKDLNTKVFTPRQGQIEITALGQPNVLLLIGRKEAMEGLKDVIKQLDTPLDPNSQLRVFKLVNSSAVDAETLIKNFFGEPPAATAAAPTTTSGALIVRVKVVADYRTNSLIVQASPRDQAEVARLVAEIDADSSPAESEIRIFPVKYAVASDLQTILSNAINGTQGAATTGVGQQQQQQQPAGGAASSAKVPSSQLTLAPKKGNERVDSGLLTGVVVNNSPTINALIVRAPTRSMPLIKALIDQLDIPSSVEARIKVFEVKNGDATTLATALQQAFGLPTTQQTNTANTNVGLGGLFGLNQAALSGSAESSLVPLRIATETRTNSIIVSGSSADLEVIEALYLRLDEDNAKQRTLEVIWLRNSSAIDVATAVTNLITSQRTNLQAITAPVGQAGQAAGSIYSVIERTDREVYVIPEANTNSLIISAMPRYMPMIRQVIERLDRQQPMISVEILIAEVSLNDAFDLGAEFGIQDALLFDRGSATGGTLTSPGFNQGNPLTRVIPPIGTPQNVAGQASSGFGVGRSNASLNYGGLVLAAGSESVSMLFRALQDANRVQILSRPHLMTIDNNIANVQVGSLVPRIGGSTLGVTGTQQSISDIPVGLIMQIQPRTNQDGLINMIVAVTRSSLDTTTPGVQIATGVFQQVINTTQAQTRVTAYDGQTVVLSGLITKVRNTKSRRIPFLADIPLAGALFRFDSESEVRTELLVVMTPRVINFNNDEKLEMIKQVESSRMSYCMADILNIHGDVGLSPGNGLWGPATSPVIYPDMQPTVDFENGSGPRRMMPSNPDPILDAPGVELLEGYSTNTPVRSNARGSKTLIEATGNGSSQPTVNSVSPIQNSSYQQNMQQGTYGVAPASYQAVPPPVARIANGR